MTDLTPDAAAIEAALQTALQTFGGARLERSSKGLEWRVLDPDEWDAAWDVLSTVRAGLAALVAENERLRIYRSTHVTIPDERYVLQVEAERDALRAQVAVLQGFVQHKRDCAFLWATCSDTTIEPDCDCGLDTVLAATAPNG